MLIAQLTFTRHFSPLYEHLDFEARKQLALLVVSNALTNETQISLAEDVSENQSKYLLSLFMSYNF